MSKTEKNLKDASPVNPRPTASTSLSPRRPRPKAIPGAKLFRAAAEAETVHATPICAPEGVKSTLENLKESLGGETYEFQSMYPP